MVSKIRPNFGLVLTQMELVILTQQLYSTKSNSLFIPLLAGYWLLTQISNQNQSPQQDTKTL
jgi:hypothetical protein